ncbi:MAG: methyltransferase domain-containing protein [Gammaproteobacteria bacterium]|nr:methyltransferase domain-containing protein [Gammaproteobacteria bacterium]
MGEIEPPATFIMELPERFFSREDETPDEQFYLEPRFTTHIDEATILEITKYYREVLSPSDRLLDLMSSWVSHLPMEIGYQQISGLGMNNEELARNLRLDDFIVHNLNTDPRLPYADDSYDAVMIIVSIQYLIKPLEVFSEIARVLTPGGKCIVAMSHRLFPTKAIYAFQMLAPAERCRLVSAYMEQTLQITDIKIIDRSPRNADPLWLVVGRKIK